MAVEKLYTLATDTEHDLIVLDTPPTRHALDFLDAPDRLLAVLNSRALAILQNPAVILTRAGSRVAQLVLGAVLRALERFTGLTLLSDIGEFVGAFEGMYDALRERATAVAQLLRAPTTAFVLVTSPDTRAIGETEAFYRALEATAVPCAGVIVNRVLPRELFEATAVPPPAGALPAALHAKLVDSHADLRALAAHEYEAIERLRVRLGLTRRLLEVPAFPEDLASLADVGRFARVLLNGAAPT
jgi:anion-transporting  ArsA/GET3 family ATPase